MPSTFQTDNTTPKPVATPATATKNAGDPITADTYANMVQLINDLLNHNHQFTDDYYSNCECQCGRGTL